MANERHVRYRGCAIVTRWAESRSFDDESPTKRFTASFSVDPPDPHDSAWQEFPEDAFTTPADASENALEVAKRSIDRTRRR
jgi:hypothetical protein